MTDFEKVKKEIVRGLKPVYLDRIILFGSYAYGDILNCKEIFNMVCDMLDVNQRELKD